MQTELGMQRVKQKRKFTLLVVSAATLIVALLMLAAWILNYRYSGLRLEANLKNFSLGFYGSTMVRAEKDGIYTRVVDKNKDYLIDILLSNPKEFKYFSKKPIGGNVIKLEMGDSMKFEIITMTPGERGKDRVYVRYAKKGKQTLNFTVTGFNLFNRISEVIAPYGLYNDNVQTSKFGAPLREEIEP